MASALCSLLLCPTQVLLHNCQYVCLGLCLHGPQLALVWCHWLTLVESALITSRIPANSFPESKGTGELTLFYAFGDLGACV